MSKPEQRALVPTLRAGSKALGIVPQTFDDCFRLAQCAAASNTVPAGHDATPEGITMVILFGLELGIPPMQAIQGITKINGKFCIYGDLVPALLWSHGFDIDQSLEGEGDAMKAVCTITRPNGKKITREFSVADAKVAQLWGANTWKKFPKRMLGWRALGFAKSDGASDIMRGLSIVELEKDITPETPQSKAAVLPVPTDIDDGTAPVVSEAEASQAKPEAEEPSAILLAYENDLKGAKSEKALTVIDRRHKDALATLDADMGKVAEEMRAKALAQVKGGKPAKDEAQGALLE